MREIQQKLDQAYMRLSRIPVSGSNVKQMALAMQDIEDAFRMAGERADMESAPTGKEERRE